MKSFVLIVVLWMIALMVMDWRKAEEQPPLVLVCRLVVIAWGALLLLW